MKCPICGKQTLPGAKLCSPCRAALKRAKDDSVWELPASQRPGELEPSPARAPQWVLGAPRLAGWRAWGIALAALAVCAGLGGVQFMRNAEPAAVAGATPIAPVTAPVVDGPTAPPQAAVPAPMSARAETPPAASAAHPDPGVVQPPRHAENPLPARPKAKLAPETAPPVAPAPVAEPAAVERPVAPPAVPQEGPARPADPWQRMNDALARCRAQDLFARLGCEHRARATYCEGHWGEVAQCPGGVPVDHGQ